MVPSALDDAQADMIAEIGRLRLVLDGACAPDPAVAGEAACQTEASGLRSFGPATGRKALLHDLHMHELVSGGGGGGDAQGWKEDVKNT